MRRALLLAIALAALPGAAQAVVAFTGAYLGSSGVAIPNVVGGSTGAADTAITGAGFVVGTTTSQCNAAAVNTVLTQSPLAGEFATAGTLVGYNYSSGIACKNKGPKKPRFGFL